MHHGLCGGCAYLLGAEPYGCPVAVQHATPAGRWTHTANLHCWRERAACASGQPRATREQPKPCSRAHVRTRMHMHEAHTGMHAHACECRLIRVIPECRCEHLLPQRDFPLASSQQQLVHDKARCIIILPACPLHLV